MAPPPSGFAEVKSYYRTLPADITYPHWRGAPFRAPALYSFCCDKDTSKMNNNVQIFTGENDETWHKGIVALLCSKGLCPKVNKPRPEDREEETEDWETIQFKAPGIIALRLSPEILARLHRLP